MQPRTAFQNAAPCARHPRFRARASASIPLGDAAITLATRELAYPNAADARAADLTSLQSSPPVANASAALAHASAAKTRASQVTCREPLTPLSNSITRLTRTKQVTSLERRAKTSCRVPHPSRLPREGGRAAAVPGAQAGSTLQASAFLPHPGG